MTDDQNHLVTSDAGDAECLSQISMTKVCFNGSDSYNKCPILENSSFVIGQAFKLKGVGE